MRLSFPCRSCGYVNHSEWSQVGRSLCCGGCGAVTTVPAPMEPAGLPTDPPSQIRFACPLCGRKFATKPALAGQKIRCTGCGAGVRVPEIQATPAVQPPPSRSTPKTFGGIDNPSTPGQPARLRKPDSWDDPRPRVNGAAVGASPRLEELGAIEGVSPRRHTEAVLWSRAEMIEQARRQASEPEPVAAAEQREKTKRKKQRKKKGASDFDPKETLQLVAGAGAFVAVLAFLAWSYPEFRFPLGGLLCVVGFIVYLLGAASLRQHVAEEGVFRLLLFRFCPPYQWWYVATHWGETRDFVAFFAAGLIILGIGGWVIERSPVGSKAAESERAHQKAERGGRDVILPALRTGEVDIGD